MKIELWSIGKTRSKPLAAQIDEYLTRVKRYNSMTYLEWPESKKKDRSHFQSILSKLTPQDHLVLLDENGKQFTSVGFARQLEKLQTSGSRRLIFLVGDAFGFDEATRKRANSQLSLSTMTFTHDMIRLFFLEQLYRAFTIRHNQPYHH